MPSIINVVRLLALTGCRLGEIRNLQWRDVDLEGAAIRLPTSKTGARTITIGAPAMALLASLDGTDGHVFYDADPAEPLTTNQLQKAWQRLRQKAGLPLGRMHDSPRSAL